MNRLLCVLLAAILLMGMTACTDKDTSALCEAAIMSMQGRSMSGNVRVSRVNSYDTERTDVVSGRFTASRLFEKDMRMEALLYRTQRSTFTMQAIGDEEKTYTSNHLMGDFRAYYYSGIVYINSAAHPLADRAGCVELLQYEIADGTVKRIEITQKGAKVELCFTIAADSDLATGIQWYCTRLNGSGWGTEAVCTDMSAVMIVDAAGRLESLRLNYESQQLTDEGLPCNDFAQMEFFLDVFHYNDVDPIVFPDYIL